MTTTCCLSHALSTRLHPQTMVSTWLRARKNFASTFPRNRSFQVSSFKACQSSVDCWRSRSPKDRCLSKRSKNMKSGLLIIKNSLAFKLRVMDFLKMSLKVQIKVTLSSKSKQLMMWRSFLIQLSHLTMKNLSFSWDLISSSHRRCSKGLRSSRSQ